MNFAWLAALLLAATGFASAATLVTTFAGNLIPSGTATNIGIGASGVTTDPAGNVYFCDSSNHTVRKITVATGIMTVLAGTGTAGYSGDGGAAGSAQLNTPKGIARDSSGNLYIADTSNHRIRKIDAATGNISTIAGTGTGTYGGDGAAATSARVNSPASVTLDNSGNIYIADTSNNRIRKIDAVTGNISTVAGNGTGGYLSDNVAATSTRINAPRGVAVDGSGNIYIADTSNNRIRKVDSGGTITTYAGTGTASFSGDNGAATSATIRAPQGVTLDGSGNMYIADTTNHRIRKITGGIITTIAGVGGAGYSGDNGAATSGQLSSPVGIAVDSSGNVYIGDSGNLRLRKIAGGIITTAAGTGSAFYGGDGGAATSAQFTSPQAMVFDTFGNMYLSDSGTHRIRKIDTSGNVTTIAGTGVAGYSGDNGQATSAQLNTPLGIAIDGSNNIYIADGNNNRVRKVNTSTGIITTFAGDGTGSFGGDNGPATSAQLFGPFAVAIFGTSVYLTDTGNNRVRKVDSGGTITTYAGDGTAAYGGDNGLATSAQFNTPIGIAFDSAGNMFVTDYSNGSIRKIAAGTNIITTVAGNGANGYGGDNGLATSAQLNSPRAVAVDGSGNIYITDTTNSRIRKVDTGGIITTIAGTGSAGFSGDNGNPAAAQVSIPQSILVAGDGTIYFGDTGNRRFRKIFTATAPGAPTGVAATPGDGTASVTFAAPASNGGTAVTGYTVTSNPAGGVDGDAGSTSLTHAITGLTNGVTYTFSVTATNVAGTSAASAPSAGVIPHPPETVPGAPTIGTATPGNGQASVAFTPGTDGGCAIWRYTATSSPGGITATGSASPIIVAGLSNGTAYTFSVAATNCMGTGAASAASSPVTPAPAPLCTLSASPAKITAGGTAVLSASCSPVADSFVWTNTGFGTSVAAGTVTPAATTTYAVVGYNGAGAGNTALATVTVEPPAGTTTPACKLTATPNLIAQGGSTYLFATCTPAATSYEWSTAVLGADKAGGTIKPAATATYTVTGINANGRGNTASATVIVGPALTSAAPALFVNASTSPNKSSVVRIANASAQKGIVAATAFDENGALLGDANAIVGTIQPNQTLTAGSADLERSLGFTPASPTSKYTVFFYADVPALQIINYVRDNASGLLSLGQALSSDRASTSTAASVTRSAWLLHAAASPTKTSVVRVVNTSEQAGNLSAILTGGAASSSLGLGSIGPRQMLTFTSADLESLFHFSPSGATEKYRVSFNADLPSLEVVDFSKGNATGQLALAQAQLDDRSGAVGASRNVLSVLSSNHPLMTTVVRLVNPTGTDAAVGATAYDEAGNTIGSGTLGTVAAAKTLALDSAQIEALLNYRLGTPTALARLVLTPSVSGIEVLNHHKVLSSGDLQLAQPQTDSRAPGAASPATRTAFIVYPSNHATTATELRIVNTSAQGATLVASAYDDSGALIGANQELTYLRPNQMLTLTAAQIERVMETAPNANSRWRVVFSANLPNFELINYAKDLASGVLMLAQPQAE